MDWLTSKTFWFNFALLVGTFLVDLPKEFDKYGLDDTHVLQAAAVGSMILRAVNLSKMVGWVK